MSNPINILFDAKPIIDKNRSGIGYYTAGLIKALAVNYPKELNLTGYYFSFLGENKPDLTEYENIGIKFVPIRFFPGSLLSPIARIFGIQFPLELFHAKKYDVVLFTNFISVPTLRRTPQIITIHDLCYLDFPEYIRENNLTYLRRLLPKSVKRSSLIIAVSEFTKQRIMVHFGNKNTIVTPIPVTPPNSSPTEKRICSEKINSILLRHQPYMLFLGTIEPRKNIDAMLDAYLLLPKAIQQKYSLIIAGGNGWKNETTLDRIKSLRSKGAQIITTGYINESEKEELYKRASLFILPSHYEGFGMPILEAMQYGIPVTVSNIQVFHEVAGSAALYFDEDNPTDIAQKVTKILMDKDITNKLRKKGYKNLEQFSWEDNAKNIFEAIIRLAASRYQK